MSESHQLSDKLDYNQITDYIYIGSNMCCQTHFAEELIKQGIKADISLEYERIDAPFGVDIFLWLPTVDNSAPSPDQITTGVSTLRQIEELTIKTYVHCQFGHGRATTLVAAYLIKEKGMTTDKAIALIKEKRPVIHLAEVQIAALKKLEP